MTFPIFSDIKKNDYLKLLLFFVSFSWFIKFSGAVLPLYLIKSGLSFSTLAAGITLSMFGQIFAISVLSWLNVKNRHMWIFSILLYILVFALYVLVPITGVYLLSVFLFGIASVTFYSAYNISHFETVARDKTGSGSAMFFNILAGVGIVAPIIAGTVATLSIRALLAFSFMFAIVALSFISFQKERQVSFSLRDSLIEIKKVKWLIFLRGIHEALTWGVIPLLTFTIIHDFFDLGVYATVVATISVVIGYFVGKYSDTLKTKITLLAPLAFVNGLFTLLFIFKFFQLNIVWWAILNLVWGKIDGIYDQTALAFIMDETHDRTKTIFGRELVLNIGRFSGMVVVAFGFFFPAFLGVSIAVLASAMFMYALVILRMRREKQRQLGGVNSIETTILTTE
jgi:MFS family permease